MGCFQSKGVSSPGQGALLEPVIEAALGEDERREIMRHLQSGLKKPSGKLWKRVYAGLVLAEILLQKEPSELLAETSQGRHFDLVQRLAFLEHFEYDTDRRIQNFVRAKAKALRAELVPRLQDASDNCDSLKDTASTGSLDTASVRSSSTDAMIAIDTVVAMISDLSDPDLFDVNNELKDSKPVPLPWASQLPPHLRVTVCKAAVRTAQRIAANGLDENRPHHGFIVIVGDEQALETCGKAGFNPFQGRNLCLLDSQGEMDEDTFDILRRNAFNVDGAIVVGAKTSRVVAAGWFVGDISMGGGSGGARSRSAKAVAQQARGCYVIKCSEDSTGEVTLHLFAERLSFKGVLESDEVEFDEEARARTRKGTWP